MLIHTFELDGEEVVITAHVETHFLIEFHLSEGVMNFLLVLGMDFQAAPKGIGKKY
jgi:hypothetical protein